MNDSEMGVLDSFIAMQVHNWNHARRTDSMGHFWVWEFTEREGWVSVDEYMPTRKIAQAIEAAEFWCDAHEPAGFVLRRCKWAEDAGLPSDRRIVTVRWGTESKQRVHEERGETFAEALCLALKAVVEGVR